MRFSASLRERHGEVLVRRDLEGNAPATAFAFEHSLQAATLMPPPPFAGRASLSRREDSVSPILSGDLTIDFPGRSNVPLTGPGIHVGLVHARFTQHRGPHAQI